MRKLVTGLLLAVCVMGASNANTNFSFPNELSVREHWISLTKSYDIETKTQKLGTLYRRFFSLLLTYDFYDPTNVKTATAKARFFSFGAHLDIYDQTDSFIGSVEEKIFTFYPTFEIIARDSSTKLARAEMNFWGTKFYIYDPASNQEMAIMSRPFFRVKNDWTIQVTNRNLLEQKNIDPRVLMTVLAVQGEIEDWKKDHRSSYNLKAANTTNKQYSALSQQVNKVSSVEGLDKLAKPSQHSLEQIANELDKKFNAENQLSEDASNEEKTKAFTSFCLNLVQSNELSDAKKKAVITLLNLRLQSIK